MALTYLKFIGGLISLIAIISAINWAIVTVLFSILASKEDLK